MGEGSGVFWKTGTAVAGTGAQKLPADSFVKAHAPGDRINIHACGFAKVGDLVDEGDLRGQKGIGGIFNQLGRFRICPDKRGPICEQSGVYLFHHLLCPGAVGSHDHPVRPEKITDGFALPEKFRVAHHIKGDFPGEISLNNLPHLFCRAHGNGRFINNHRVVFKIRGNLLCNLEDLTQIGRAVPEGRGAYGNKDDFGPGSVFINFFLDKESFFLQAAGDKRRQIFFIKRD